MLSTPERGGYLSRKNVHVYLAMMIVVSSLPVIGKGKDLENREKKRKDIEYARYSLLRNKRELVEADRYSSAVY